MLYCIHLCVIRLLYHKSLEITTYYSKNIIVQMEEFMVKKTKTVMKALLFPALLLPALLLSQFGAAKALTPFRELVAESALLIEADSGAVLFEHNKTARQPTDGLARVMTLLIAATAITDYRADPRDLVEMTETAWNGINANSPTLGISPGEEMSLLDLMYCAYTGGASEACNLIAEHLAGDVRTFVDRMNARAKELGCETTNYSNTHGQYSTYQYTTTMDQYLVFREAMKNPLFAEINGAYRHTIEATNMSESRILISSNSLLNSNGKYYYSSCTAGAASNTYEGGYSYIGFAEADELSLIAIVLGSDIIVLQDESTQMRNLTETRRLFEWGFTQYGWRTILPTNELVDKVPILNGAGADYVNLRPETAIRRLLENDIPLEQFERIVTIYSDEKGETLIAPITAGDVLGEVTLMRNNIEYGTVLLVANTNVDLHRLVFIRMQIMDVLASKTARMIILTLSLLIVIYIALVIRYNVLRHKRIQKIKQAKKQLAEDRRKNNYDEYDF